MNEQATDPTTSFIKEINHDDRYSVKLITSVDDQGEFFYAYLLLKTEVLPYLETALRTRRVNLTEYGAVLATGSGLEPDEETKSRVEKELRLEEIA